MTDRPGRIPPFNRQAEEAAIGSMLMSRDARDVLLEKVRPEDFYVPKLAAAFVAIGELVDQGLAVDVVTVAEQLRRADKGGDGTKDELVQIMAATPVAANARTYGRIVTDLAIYRRVIHAASEIADLGYDLGNVDTDDPSLADRLDPASLLDRARDAIESADLPVLGGTLSPDLDEFLTGPDEYRWVIPDLLEHKDRLLLVAPEGYGKSTLLRQFALCASQGMHPFMLYEIPACRCMIVDLENPPSLTRRKLADLRDRFTGDLIRRERYDPSMLRIEARPEGVDLLSRADQTWLLERVAANRPDLLCIGPAYKLHESEDEKSADVRRVLKQLDKIRHRYDCAIMLETHAPHESFARGGKLRPSGSRLWIRWPEFVLTLSPASAQTTNLADLDHARGPRDERAWPNRLRRGGRWPWEGDR